MNATKLNQLKDELAQVRRAAVAASIAGDYAKADCLTSKAVGMQTTLDIAQKVSSSRSNSSAVGELEGIERVLSAITPVPKC